MKKILSLIAAGAMALGLIGCSGDLHDDVKIDPNAMKGNWFYTVLDVTPITESLSIIFNDGTNQTVNIENIDPESGSVAYVWASKSGKDPAPISTRTDCPDKSSLGGANKLVVYCFSNAAKVNIYAWEGETKIADSWPGKAMETDAVIPMVDVVINGATVTANGLPEELNGTTLYFTGAFNKWTAPGKEGTIEGTVTNGSITITLPELSAEVEQGAAQEIIVEGKFANTGWLVPEIAGLINEKQDGLNNVKVTITPSKKTIVGTYSANNLADKYECTWEVK